MTDCQKKEREPTRENTRERSIQDLDQMRMVKKGCSAKKSSGEMLAADLIYRGELERGKCVTTKNVLFISII